MVLFWRCILDSMFRHLRLCNNKQLMVLCLWLRLRVNKDLYKNPYNFIIRELRHFEFVIPSWTILMRSSDCSDIKVSRRSTIFHNWTSCCESRPADNLDMEKLVIKYARQTGNCLPDKVIGAYHFRRIRSDC